MTSLNDFLIILGLIGGLLMISGGWSNTGEYFRLLVNGKPKNKKGYKKNLNTELIGFLTLLSAIVIGVLGNIFF